MHPGPPFPPRSVTAHRLLQPPSRYLPESTVSGSTTHFALRARRSRPRQEPGPAFLMNGASCSMPRSCLPGHGSAWDSFDRQQTIYAAVSDLSQCFCNRAMLPGLVPRTSHRRLRDVQRLDRCTCPHPSRQVVHRVASVSPVADQVPPCVSRRNGNGNEEGQDTSRTRRGWQRRHCRERVVLYGTSIYRKRKQICTTNRHTSILVLIG